MLKGPVTRPGIDFIIVIFYRFGYAQILTESIKKYVKNIPYTINIINNGINKGENNGFDILKDMFKDEPNVNIIAGMEQDIDSNVLNPNTYECKHDGRKVSIGSHAKVVAMSKGLLNSNREYVCYLDADTIFLNEWVDDVIPLLNNNFFVSHKWREDIQMDGNNFCVVKRETLDDNYLYEKGDLYPNLHYKDSNGMLSYWAQKENKPFVILPNSYENVALKSQHILDLQHGEQSWIHDKPIFYHQGRGSTRADDIYINWIKVTSTYLGMDFEDIRL
jgi:hypothetical protein